MAPQEIERWRWREDLRYLRCMRHVPLFLVLSLSLAAAGCGENDRRLKVTGISKAAIDYEKGETVAISGNRFTADGPRTAKVFFGKDPNYAQGIVKRFNGDNELIVEAPGGKLGDTVDVLVVFEPGGQLKIPNAIKYIDKSDGATVDDLTTKK